MTTDDDRGPDTSGYVDYLITNREFTAPAVEAAVASISLADPGRPLRVLDAGTGAGGALPELARRAEASGPEGRVLALDADERAIETTRAWVGDRSSIELRVADLRDVAADASRSGGVYDLIWSSDVIWPATFDDPAAVVRELGDALASRGTLALFTTNYYQSMMLPGHSRLERLIRTASELTWGLPDDGPTHAERLGAWMRQAGLADITVTAFPLAASTALETPARTYMERIVWPEMRHAVAARGQEAGMSEEDVARAEELLDPGNDDWIGADPDAFTVHPALLWTGRAPA
ncbi:class I SAM-dependent methyltransferase [Aeromicrobium sp. YIM 150415]|uniref:class I SAM-dependent methyltransferase n=1 Tax=Aeromicrobium sp. YIM 150415 TaxID=2803912 RepID=UPI0019637CC7|nr:class I SAM-dependent methyltransferase [Aeromicrobium sp. YIM 150415]MBM9463640.1 class I SAM-dependent methyltransferase [Aeromicrobium sp. YIM 150415]